MKKVMYLGGFELPDKNAAAQRVVAIGKTMQAAGYEVEFIGVTKDSSEVGKSRFFSGFTYTSVKYPTNIKEWLYQITRFIPLEVIGERKPSAVVLYNFPAIAGNRIRKYCQKKGIKVLADLTEWYVVEGNSPRDYIKRWDTNRRMRWLNFRVDGIIAISKYLKFYKDKVKTVYIPATVDLQDEKWERDRVIECHNPIRLVYAGSPGAGQKDKLDVLIKAVEGSKRFVLDVFGITKEQFQHNFGQYVQGDNIRFHGRVSHLKAIKMVVESDFDVIIRDDNLVTRAGFPTKFVEAYSCGTPVIATPSSNICDYLKDGENGFVVNDSQPLSKALERIASMDTNALSAVKKRAMSMCDFDFRNYIKEIQFLLS